MQSANVEASGAVGPEAMTSRASPTTSETITLTTPAGAAVRAQLATAETGQMLPDGIEFRDGRAAAQQQLRHLLHVFQSDAGHRGRRQGTGPAL